MSVVDSRVLRALCVAGVGVVASGASGAMFTFSDPSGLSAEVEVTLGAGGTSLDFRIRNTSTAVPMGFDESDQLLTGVSFILPMGVTLTGGSAVVGPSSASVNFDGGSAGPGDNIGGEWGWGNTTTSGSLGNAISGNTSGMTAFGGPNLDGPSNLNGPQGGLVSASEPVPLSGLGAIKDEILVTVTLNQALADLGFLSNGLQVEYGSDAAFLYIPTPGAGAILALSGLVAARRRR